MEKLPKKITIGDKYRPAIEIRDEGEAKEYFEVLVQHSMEHFVKSREEAEELERINLGYYAGYYDNETRIRVERLFGCAHPIFGKAADGVPTAEEASKAGERLAAEST